MDQQENIEILNQIEEDLKSTNIKCEWKNGKLYVNYISNNLLITIDVEEDVNFQCTSNVIFALIEKSYDIRYKSGQENIRSRFINLIYSKPIEGLR